MLTQERLKELFTYNPETGWFTNNFSRGRALATARAGSPSGHGYRKINVDYIKYYEHHLAWLYVYGYIPDELDHEDRDGSHNWIDNLRIANATQNNCNTQQPTGMSGLRGAYLNKRNLKWYSQIQFGSHVKYLGSFDSAEEAHEAFESAAYQLHGEFYAPQ